MKITRINRRGFQAISIGALALLIGACETTPKSIASDVKTDFAISEKADFSSYKTYYVLDVPPGENEVAPPKPFSRIVVEAAVFSGDMGLSLKRIAQDAQRPQRLSSKCLGYERLYFQSMTPA